MILCPDVSQVLKGANDTYTIPKTITDVPDPRRQGVDVCNIS